MIYIFIVQYRRTMTSDEEFKTTALTSNGSSANDVEMTTSGAILSPEMVDHGEKSDDEEPWTPPLAEISVTTSCTRRTDTPKRTMLSSKKWHRFKICFYRGLQALLGFLLGFFATLFFLAYGFGVLLIMTPMLVYSVESLCLRYLEIGQRIDGNVVSSARGKVKVEYKLFPTHLNRSMALEVYHKEFRSVPRQKLNGHGVDLLVLPDYPRSAFPMVTLVECSELLSTVRSTQIWLVLLGPFFMWLGLWVLDSLTKAKHLNWFWITWVVEILVLLKVVMELRSFMLDGAVQVEPEVISPTLQQPHQEPTFIGVVPTSRSIV
jgi:hypothetical protein